MCQNYILKNKEEKYLEILTTLLKYIIEHQSDFQESNRIYEYMRTISYASKYLEDETYIKRVEKLLIKIDSGARKCDKYSPVNAFLVRVWPLSGLCRSAVSGLIVNRWLSAGYKRRCKRPCFAFQKTAF